MVAVVTAVCAEFADSKVVAFVTAVSAEFTACVVSVAAVDTAFTTGVRSVT